MEWDSQAVDVFIKMSLTTTQKESAKVFAEKEARRNRSDKVTLKEIETTKKVYYAGVPGSLHWPAEVARIKEIEKRIAEGETDLRERMDEEARDVLAREIDLFGVELCSAQYFGCRNQNIELIELKKEVEQKLRELKVTELIADLIPEGQKILAHNPFSVSISACSYSCTVAEVKPFGVTGMAKPTVTDADCSECFTCADGCPRHAILIRNGRPEIDITKCDCCGSCVKTCPNGLFAFENTGYRIFVGGGSGRFQLHQTAHELFKIANKETLFRALEACIELIREESLGEESLASIINRVGVAPIFQKIYSEGGKNE